MTGANRPFGHPTNSSFKAWRSDLGKKPSDWRRFLATQSKNLMGQKKRYVQSKLNYVHYCPAGLISPNCMSNTDHSFNQNTSTTPCFFSRIAMPQVELNGLNLKIRDGSLPPSGAHPTVRNAFKATHCNNSGQSAEHLAAVCTACGLDYSKSGSQGSKWVQKPWEQCQRKNGVFQRMVSELNSYTQLALKAEGHHSTTGV